MQRQDPSGADAPAWLYTAEVMHRRHRHPPVTFRYRLLYGLFDIDRLDELDRSLRWFSHDRFNLFSLHDVDHGARRAGELRRWAEQALRAQGCADATARIRLLCLPRVLGHAFNPLSLWYCERSDGRLGAVIAEVRNTFGERHSYVLTRPGAAIDADAALDKEKIFHVSPFFDVAGRYRFRLAAPGENLAVHIESDAADGRRLDATLRGKRIAMNEAALLRGFSRLPWATAQVLAAIHWEAARLWLRGATFHPKPPPPTSDVS